MHAPTRRSRYSLSNASEALSACRYAPGFPAGESSDFGLAECRMDLGLLRMMAGRPECDHARPAYGRRGTRSSRRGL